MLVAAVLAATAFGMWRARTAGRLAVPHGRVTRVAALTPDDIGGELSERATLVQFSSAFCAPCRATRQVLAHAARTADGVRHVEVDAESHLDLVRRLGITKTPTTFVLDRDGVVVRRSTGAPKLAEVVALLTEMAKS